MEWEFSPEDVVKGRADYGLTEFRRDLAEEVRMNLGAADDAQQERAFALLYDLCYAQATSRDLEKFIAAYAYDPPTCQFLKEVAPLMTGNIEMLGAILQRMIMDGVEAGMPLETAVGEAAARHAQVAVVTA